MASFNKLFYVWIVVVIAIFGGLITLGYVYKNRVQKYKDYENVLVESAKIYVAENSLYPEEKQSIKISVKKLKKVSNLSKKDIIDDCGGYVKVTKKTNFSYKAILKCENYKTKA